MSSLLQHHGGRSADGRKVELLLYLVDRASMPADRQDWPLCTFENAENIGNTRLAVLYRIFRRPVGMCGHFVVFRYNGAEHVPDLSLPIAVDKLPRDAVRLSDAEAMRYWKGGAS